MTDARHPTGSKGGRHTRRRTVNNSGGLWSCRRCVAWVLPPPTPCPHRASTSLPPCRFYFLNAVLSVQGSKVKRWPNMQAGKDKDKLLVRTRRLFGCLFPFKEVHLDPLHSSIARLLPFQSSVNWCPLKKLPLVGNNDQISWNIAQDTVRERQGKFFSDSPQP